MTNRSYTPPPVTEGLLLLDVGNSRVGIGVWDADGVHDVQRVSVHDPDCWHEPLTAAWQRVRTRRGAAVAIASVHPHAARELSDLAESVCDVEPRHVRDDLPFPIALQIENPDEVGVDRICSAAAAYERINDACAIASFGTAITIDCVSAAGDFLGGSILPGLQMSCTALHENTAQLPEYSPLTPHSAFGRNTREAIGAGVTLAAVGALREIVERFATELGRWPQLVITGGDAPLIRSQADFVDSVVPDLCLMGVALAYRRAAGQP